MYPPRGKALIKWFLAPYFPSRVLRLHLRNGVSEEYYDEEVQYIHVGKSLSIIRCVAEELGSKTIAVAGGDPWSYAILESPWRLFLGRIMQWIMLWYSLIYFSMLLPISLEIDVFQYTIYDVYIVGLGVYFVMNIRLFRRASIEYVELHEFGQYGDLRCFVPGPVNQSKMTFEQVMKFVGYITAPTFSSETLKQLEEDLEKLSSENQRLWVALARAEKSASRFYEAALADVLLTAPRELVESIRKQLAVEYSAKVRLLVVLLIVLIPLSFAIGFLLAGGSLGFEFTSPSP